MGSDGTASKQIAIFGHWFPRAEKTKQLLDAFEPTLQHVRENNDEILCFYLLTEKKYDGTAEVLTASCFKSTKSYDEYLASEARSTLDELCKKDDILREPQREERLETAAGFPVRSTGIFSAPGIHGAMAKINYVPGTRAEGIEHWKKVASFVEENEKEGTYSYWFLADPKNEDVLYSLERYRNEAYLWDVHVPSTALQANIAIQKDIRTGLVLRGFESVEHRYDIKK